MRTSAVTLHSLLFEDLLAAGWNGSLNQYPGQGVKQFAMSQLVKTLTKKFIPSSRGTTPAGDAAALDLFLKVNARCETFASEIHPRTEIEEIALGEVKAFLDKFFYPDMRYHPVREGYPFCEYGKPFWSHRDFVLSLPEIEQTIGVGPGASVGAKRTDFFTKLANSALTSSNPSLHKLYVQAISCNPTWSATEISRSNRLGEEVVKGSRLSFVPKTSEISRTICTEPILNMLFQKGVQGALERRLVEVVGINLSNQPDENSRLAQIGSVSGEFGTIDLSSASDSLSLGVVREFFPRRVFDVLCAFRTPVTILPDGTSTELHMLSSMGNAFTFPLQTIFFSAIVIGAYKVLGLKHHHFRGRRNDRSNFAVFGDDIIVCKEAYNLVCRLLFLTGFTVNHDKSFNQGLFRESCGHDYFNGHNVRGVYLRALNDVGDLYSAINRLNRWSARWGVPLVCLVQYLQKGCRFLPVPFEEDDSHGIKVPLDLVDRPRYDKHTGGVLYKFLYSLPNQLDLSKVEKRDDLIREGWNSNPDGLLLSFVAGYIRMGFVGFRVNLRKTQVRQRSSSRWDWITSACGESPEFGESWKALTARNLCKGSWN